MSVTGKSFAEGLAFYVGDPASAAVAAFDVPPGTIVLDQTNAVARLKTAAAGTNTAGYARLLVQGGLNGNTKVSTAQLDATTTTLADIPGLTGFSLVAGATYHFEINLAGTAGGTGGWKVAFNSATATLTSIQATAIGYTASAVAVSQTTTTTNQASLIASNTAFTFVRITGSLVVNAAGNVAVQFAENSANSTTSVLLGSTASFTRAA